MMLYPPMADLVEKVGSRYLLVNLVARRARDISAAAEEEGNPSDEKPVSDAINEVYNGQLMADVHTGEFGEAADA
ncbi:MAG: DNA-directed RNA polymerase subunit omega [Candidatus Heteroscillospira sp.]|jgi:DNA-directed RNA polymerase subunit omega